MTDDPSVGFGALLTDLCQLTMLQAYHDRGMRESAVFELSTSRPRCARSPVLWPDHCIAGSAGAALHPRIPSEAIRAIVRKGTDLDADSYSGFRDNPNSGRERRPTGQREERRAHRAPLARARDRDRSVCDAARRRREQRLIQLLLEEQLLDQSHLATAALVRRRRATAVVASHLEVCPERAHEARRMILDELFLRGRQAACPRDDPVPLGIVGGRANGAPAFYFLIHGRPP
jgi:hypothetical protein